MVDYWLNEYKLVVNTYGNYQREAQNFVGSTSYKNVGTREEAKNCYLAKDVKFDVKDKFSRKRKLKKYAKKLAKVILLSCANKNSTIYNNLLLNINKFERGDDKFREEVFNKLFCRSRAGSTFSIMMATDLKTFNDILQSIPISSIDYIVDNRRDIMDNFFSKESIKINGSVIVNLKNVAVFEKTIAANSKAVRKNIVCDELRNFMKKFGCEGCFDKNKLTNENIKLKYSNI